MNDSINAFSTGQMMFQARVLIPTLLRLTEFREAQVVVLFLPDAKRRLAEADLTADFGDGVTRCGLPQYEGNFLFGVLLSLHGPRPRIMEASEREDTLVPNCPGKLGQGHSAQPSGGINRPGS